MGLPALASSNDRSAGKVFFIQFWTSEPASAGNLKIGEFGQSA